MLMAYMHIGHIPGHQWVWARSLVVDLCVGRLWVEVVKEIELGLGSQVCFATPQPCCHVE